MSEKVSNEEIKKFNELYYTYKSYAEVARQTGRSPGTVKRYIIADYKPISTLVIKKIDKTDIPKFNPEIFFKTPLSELCVLSADEREEIKDLWNELQM